MTRLTLIGQLMANQLTNEQISPYSIPNTVEGIIKFSRKSTINFNLNGETNA